MYTKSQNVISTEYRLEIVFSLSFLNTSWIDCRDFFCPLFLLIFWQQLSHFSLHYCPTQQCFDQRQIIYEPIYVIHIYHIA